MPYFAARLGSCPSKPDSRWRQSEEQADPGALVPLSSCHLVTVCPLCRGQLEAQAGIYHCAGRCGARWLEEAPGRLVDLAALPHGICGCCAPPMPLIAQGDALVCLVRPDQRYRREGQQLIALAPVPAGAAATMAAIDAALRRNSARLTTNGLFDLD
jgi:hypothetical protein